MSKHSLTNVLEAILLAAGRPLSIAQIAELFDEAQRPSEVELRAGLDELAGRFDGRGVELAEVASGWRIQVRPVHAEVVSRLWQERPTRYSRALLETLALVAYRQPVTRGEIEAIRGVTVASTIMRTLFERNWIRVVGHREVPGHPELLGTTREFLDYFGLRRLDELPTLAELRDLDEMSEQLELAQDEIETRAALPVVTIGGPSVRADDPAEDEPAFDDDEERELMSEAESPTLVAGPPPSSDR
jgi:segregation and condensation protein B